MPELLRVQDYDGPYFDGRLHAIMRTAGYGRYTQSPLWVERARKWTARFSLEGKKVLEIGCAKGFFVEQLLVCGVDAYGLDGSAYCLHTCDLPGTDAAAAIRCPDIAHRFTLGDARKALARFADDEFDMVVSIDFLACIPDKDLPALAEEMGRVSRRQAHVPTLFPEGENGPGRFYTVKTFDEWCEVFGAVPDASVIANADLVEN